MKQFLIIVLFCGLIAPKPLLAWHSKGHQIVAEMAKSLLKKNILDSVQFYLDSANFQQAAVWMDEVRTNPKFNYLKPMHYVNVAKDHTYVNNNEKNIINTLATSIQKLKHRHGLNKADIKMQLLLLFHLIGDLHQPLHVAYGEDRGGNDIHLRYLKKKTNLHTLWDADIIAREHISLSTCFNKLKSMNEQDKMKAQHIDLLNWMNESRAHLIAVYDFKDNFIDAAYSAKSKNTIETQLALAALRLAAVLEDAFK